ncbi:MAG: M50 family metallopeptidase [Bacillota bacterium]
MGGFNYNSIWMTVLLLSITVVIHEYGHFVTARAFGVTVYEFSVGFGPLIGKFKRKGIQYSLRWILIGGFCKIAGMDMTLEGETKDPETRPERLFYNLPLWKRLVVLATGPFFNFLTALVVFFSLLIFIGIPVIDSVNIERISPQSPAVTAGLHPGDKITAINNQAIKQSSDLTKLVQQSAGNPLRIKISRNGEQLIKEITPIYSPESKRYLMGVVIRDVPKFERATLRKAAGMTASLPWTTIKFLGMLIRGQIKGGVMGPIGAVDMVEQSLQLPPQFIWFSILSFASSISMSLFLFNMLPLPLPILDGGWIVIFILERLFRREFSADQKAAAYTIGLIAILTVTVLITYGDLVRLLKRFLGG